MTAIPANLAQLHRRRTELDGVRALAITAVLMFHCLQFPDLGHSLLDYTLRLASLGWAGVNIFFVLSGFLVGGILIDSRGRPNALRDFLIRRGMRIIPLYAIVVASFYLVPLLTPGLNAGRWPFEGASPWWAYVTLTQDFTVPILGRDAFYLGPTWSLAVEVQIYLLLGYGLTRAPQHAIFWMMVTGVAIAELTRIVLVASGHGLLGYFVLPARIDGACLGVIIAILMRSEVKVAAVRSSAVLIWIAALLLLGVAAGFCMDGHSIESAAVNIYTQLAVSVASAAMIAVLVAKPDGWPNRALRAAPLVWFGTISYGVYLIQLPLIGVAHALIGENGAIILGWRSAGVTVVGLIATVATAALSWRWLETPLNRWAHRVTGGYHDSEVRTPPAPFAAPPA